MVGDFGRDGEDGPPAKRGSQTGNRRAVSGTRHVFVAHNPQSCHCFHNGLAEFIRISGAAQKRDILASVDNPPLLIQVHKSGVACSFHLARDLIERLVPRDVFPVGLAGPSHLRLGQSPLIHAILLQSSALRAESAAVDRVVWIALNMHDLRDHIL